MMRVRFSSPALPTFAAARRAAGQSAHQESHPEAAALNAARISLTLIALAGELPISLVSDLFGISISNTITGHVVQAGIGTPTSPQPTSRVHGLLLTISSMPGHVPGRLPRPMLKADDLTMVDHDDFDRVAIFEEMDTARATLKQLLELADRDTLRAPSNGTKWTNEQLLFHMVFGYMVVRALLILVRTFGRLPAPVSRAYASVLDFATPPFHVVNYWGSRFAALTFNHQRMGAQLDRIVVSLQRHLRRESPDALARSMSFPTRWDPFFRPTMTLAEVYHYPTQHFDFHRRQLSGRLAATD